MDIKLTKIIDQYIQGEMSEADKKAFEERLESNPTLKAEYELQLAIAEVAKRSYFQQNIQQRAKRYHLLKTLKTVAIIVAISTLAASAIYFSFTDSTPLNTEDESSISKENVEENVNYDGLINNLEVQEFEVPEGGALLFSKNGVMISVPDSAFLMNGKAFSGEVNITFQEAISPAEIMLAGLSTINNNNLLETQGMFSFSAKTTTGDSLTINPDVGIYFEVPVDELKEGMQLYDGEKDVQGEINWVNPVPLKKIPVLADMSDLDFYPEKFEPTLDSLKWFTSKQKRDSLYLSMEGLYTTNNCDDCITQRQLILHTERKPVDCGELPFGKKLFYQNCATCHNVFSDMSGPKLYKVRDKWKNEGAKENSVYQWVQNWQKAVVEDPYAEQISRLTPTAMTTFEHLSFAEIDAIFNFVDEQKKEPLGLTDVEVYSDYVVEYYTDSISGHSSADITASYKSETGPLCAISPSKVLAFWNKKYNNTNLSTLAFQCRMQAIHNTCDNRVLDLYVNGLNRELVDIDKQVVGLGYTPFKEFVKENMGKIDMNDAHVRSLRNFYAQVARTLKNEALNNAKEEKENNRIIDSTYRKTKYQNVLANKTIKQEVLSEETWLNLKKFGFEKSPRGVSRRPSVGFRVNRGNNIIKNIDRLIREATSKRTNLTAQNIKTGEGTSLMYKPAFLQVQSTVKMDHQYAYFLPKQLSSYHKQMLINDTVSYKLNMDFKYDLLVVGIKNDDFYLEFRSTVSPQNYIIQLATAYSRKKADSLINSVCSSTKKTQSDLNNELKFFEKRREYEVHKTKQREMEKFRRNIAKQIFPCYVEEPIVESVEDIDLY